MAGHCLGLNGFSSLSARVDAPNPSCMIEISVEEATCLLRQVMKESSWLPMTTKPTANCSPLC
jgi:hypothetical protein